MAAAISVSQELLTCSVCLDILKEPVSLPCGHSFCMACILFCWDRKGVNSCPQCRKTFNPRPDLSKNIMLAELVELLMKTGLGAALSQRYAGPVGVLCDMCIGKKLTAVQLCLTCELAFCETHMWLHPKIMDWKYYKMNTPPRSLQEKVCTKHQKALEYFCRNDNTWICFLCVATSHRSHETVELGTVSAEKKQIKCEHKENMGTG
uniref:Uncharacterized protein n=1 Tax=Erpetoichthys calabaricus TaxID=27687 RepID=A0A8C4SXD4_ERPCA